MTLNRRALTQTLAKLAITPFKFIKAQLNRIVSGRFEQWVRVLFERKIWVYSAEAGHASEKYPAANWVAEDLGYHWFLWFPRFCREYSSSDHEAHYEIGIHWLSYYWLIIIRPYELGEPPN